mgnify:CR=1 FL=1
MFYSVIATSIMYAIVKSLNNFSIYQIIFYKSFAILIITNTLILKKKIKILGNNKKILFLRGILGLISMIFFFQSIKYLDLGISVSIRYSSPIFATIFALFFLKENIKTSQWFYLFLSFTGVILIKIVGIEIDLLGFLYALFSAILLGLVFVLTNKIGKTENPLVIINYFMFVSFIFSALFSINNWIVPSFIENLMLLSSGLFGYVGLLFLTKSLQGGEVNVLAPLKYLEVILSIIIGIYFFREIYTVFSLLGIFLILSGVILNIIFKKNI